MASPLKCDGCRSEAVEGIDEVGLAYCARCLGQMEGNMEARREQALGDLRRSTIAAFGHAPRDTVRDVLERAFEEGIRRKEHLAQVGYPRASQLLKEEDF